MTKQRVIRVGTIAATAVVLAGACYWGLRSFGLLGPSGEEVHVIREAPKPAPADTPDGPRRRTAVVIPTTRPADRPAVQIALAELPASFLERRASGGTKASAETPPPPAVTPPRDPLADVRPLLKKDPAVARWVARWEADAAAERVTPDARLKELAGIVRRSALAPADLDAVARAMASAEADRRVLDAWRTASTAAAASERPAPRPKKPRPSAGTPAPSGVAPSTGPKKGIAPGSTGTLERGRARE